MNIAGRKVGRWSVVDRAGADKFGRATWNCVCACGTKRVISARSLINKTSTCCGECNHKKQYRDHVSVHLPHEVVESIGKDHNKICREFVDVFLRSGETIEPVAIVQKVSSVLRISMSHETILQLQKRFKFGQLKRGVQAIILKGVSNEKND
jgi:hypothetical protein